MTAQLDLFARPAPPPVPPVAVPPAAPPSEPSAEPAPVRPLRGGEPLGPAQEPAAAYLARGLAARQPTVFLWGAGLTRQVRFHDGADATTTTGTGWIEVADAEAQLTAAGYYRKATVHQRRPEDRWLYQADVWAPR